jgi:pimeloyl-ACP methyl ester carboxylesterase
MKFAYRKETKQLNNTARHDTDGCFIQLPDGVTHYELGGPESGEVVVLVHGFSVPYFIYDPTFQFLTQSGFRVLRYDLFGRGFSDRPAAHYNVNLLVHQLAALLDALGIASTGTSTGPRPVNLIGLSMGGPIAATFTIRFPERVNKLVLIDPAGAKPIHLSPMLKTAKLPFVAETVLSLSGTEGMVKSIAKDFFDPSLVDHFISRYRVQMEFQGFRNAILSTIRNGMLDSFIHVYEALGKMNKKILLLWGRDDLTIPFAQSFDLRAVLPKVEFHVIKNTGHIPHYEKPHEVNPLLLEFLR